MIPWTLLLRKPRWMFTSRSWRRNCRDTLWLWPTLTVILYQSTGHVCGWLARKMPRGARINGMKKSWACMLPAGNCLSTPCTVWFRSMAPPSSQRTTKEEQRLQKPGNMMPSTQRPLLQRSTRQPHAFLTTTSRSPSCNDRQNSMSGRILPGCKLRWMSMQPCLMPSLFPTKPCAWRTFRKVSTEAARLQTAHGE